MNRFVIPYSIIFAASVVAYLVRLASGQFSSSLNLILAVVLFFLISLTWEFLRWLNATLDIRLPYEKNIPRRIALQLALSAVFALFIRFLIYKFGEPYLPIKLDSLFIVTTWVLYTVAAAGLNAVFITRFFIARWKDTLLKTERLEKEKAYVQFDNLKNQLNPHFLFNALTSLNSLISENPSLASQFLQHMSRVYRYVLQNKDKNFVSLGTELDFISNYVFLMETRFGAALRINITLPATVREKAIVPVTLQILIENALKHNIADLERPLAIDIYAAGDYLIVGNNLQVKKIVETSNKQGLENLKSLYRFLTESSIEIEQDDSRFSVKIPLL